MLQQHAYNLWMQCQQKYYDAPFSFSNHLDSIAFRLGWQSYRSIQLSFFPLDLLLFNFNLFSSFNNFNLYLLITDLLADLGGLQLVCQLCLCFLQVSVYSAVRCDTDWKCKVWDSHPIEGLKSSGMWCSEVEELVSDVSEALTLKCKEPLTKGHSITPQRTWIFIIRNNIYEGHLESKERFAIQRYLLIIGKKKNMQVLWHTFTYFST